LLQRVMNGQSDNPFQSESTLPLDTDLDLDISAQISRSSIF